MRRVTVAVEPPYDVVVGDDYEPLAGALADRDRVALVSQDPVADHHAPAVLAALGSDPTRVGRFTIPPGEAAKTLATVEILCRQLSMWGLRRHDAVVALGGGVVGDTAGLTAAIYHRGMAIAQVPTTLLAMVDAAIGGKTGVNLPEGKNLVGAFHQPVAVVANVTTLRTLPDVEYRSGLGEVAKYALLPDGARVAALLERHADAILARDAATLTDLVAECAAIKAAVVARDPEERTGLRATLNYGHTLAHALETTGAYTLSHGEAVAIGLVFAVHLARALERVDDATVERVHTVVSTLGLPTEVPNGQHADALLVVMGRDKKARDRLTFVLPGPQGFELVDDPPRALLDRAFHAVGVRG